MNGRYRIQVRNHDRHYVVDSTDDWGYANVLREHYARVYDEATIVSDVSAIHPEKV